MSGCDPEDFDTVSYRAGFKYINGVKQLMTNEEVIRKEAHDHFQKHGDKVQAKTRHHPHTSYDVLRGYLTKYAYGRLNRNWQDAEDAVQEAYVNVLRTAKVNGQFNFAGLYKIWLDRAISEIRRNHKSDSKLIIEDEIADKTQGLTIIELAESEDAPTETLVSIQERVNNLMDRSNVLKPKAKAIIRLTLLFGYSYKEVGEMLNVSEKRVDNTLDYFKKLYKEDVNDG